MILVARGALLGHLQLLLLWAPCRAVSACALFLWGEGRETVHLGLLSLGWRGLGVPAQKQLYLSGLFPSCLLILLGDSQSESPFTTKQSLLWELGEALRQAPLLLTPSSTHWHFLVTSFMTYGCLRVWKVATRHPPPT